MAGDRKTSREKGDGKMMKDDRSFHLRLQEFCDCFMETDYQKELEAASRGVSGDPSSDEEELALKFFGLAILYGATQEIKNFSIKKGKDGKVLFSMEGKGTYQLPPPRAQGCRPHLFHRPVHHAPGRRPRDHPFFHGAAP